MHTEVKNSNSKKKLIVLVILLVCIGVFFGAPLVFNQRQFADGNQAFSNARSFSLALLEFESEYGSFPNDSTAKRIQEFSGTEFDLSGNSSNAAFRQLIAAGVTQSEQSFYAPILGATKPDGLIKPGEALKKGEVGFAYVSGLSTKDDAATPLAFSPIIPGTTKFDADRFAGIAIVVHADASVRTYQIDEDGHIYEENIDLLSAKHPVWKGKTPDIRYPE